MRSSIIAPRLGLCVAGDRRRRRTASTRAARDDLMGTDATAIIEILDEEALAALPTSIAYAVPYAWAEIRLVRDYVLFDLLAGGRSGDVADAVVPVRRVRWPGATEDDPASTWVTGPELERLADTYRARTSRESAQARCLAAMTRALGDPTAVRVVVRFF